ncbi:hypothetical protein Bbelb_303330 [Branchiostoma belcheri]|nr:hypothetical protein Bbelb_303330 [Branchiostoma belcheri]
MAKGQCNTLRLSLGGVGILVKARQALAIQDHYRPSYPPLSPSSLSLPQWEGATLWDAIDRVDRESSPSPSTDQASSVYQPSWKVPRDRQWVRRGSEVGTEAVDVAHAVPVQVDEGEVVSRFKLHHATVKLNRILLVLNFSRARHRDKVPFLAAFLPDEIVTYTTCVGMFDIATKFPSWWTRRGKFPLGGLDSTRVSALVGLHRLRAGTPLRELPSVGHHAISTVRVERELPSCATWQGTPLVTDFVHEDNVRELPSCVTWQGTPLVTDFVHEHHARELPSCVTWVI